MESPRGYPGGMPGSHARLARTQARDTKARSWAAYHEIAPAKPAWRRRIITQFDAHGRRRAPVELAVAPHKPGEKLSCGWSAMAQSSLLSLTLASSRVRHREGDAVARQGAPSHRHAHRRGRQSDQRNRRNSHSGQRAVRARHGVRIVRLRAGSAGQRIEQSTAAVKGATPR